MKTFLVGAAACVSWSILCLNLAAQGPIGTTVNMKLDRNAMVGSQSLPAGEYTIRTLNSASNPRVLEFATNKGTKVVATVTALPLLQNTPPDETKVVFDNEGVQPRIAKILVQGKDYGYQFPKEYSPAKPAVAATVQLGFDDPNRTTANTAPSTRPAETVTSQNQSAPTVVPAPAPSEQATSQNTTQQPTVVAQNTPRPNPTQQAAPAPAPQQPAATPAQNDVQNSSANAKIPATALSWMDLVMMGLLCAGVGLFLYRRTA